MKNFKTGPKIANVEEVSLTIKKLFLFARMYLWVIYLKSPLFWTIQEHFLLSIKENSHFAPRPRHRRSPIGKIQEKMTQQLGCWSRVARLATGGILDPHSVSINVYFVLFLHNWWLFYVVLSMFGDRPHRSQDRRWSSSHSQCKSHWWLLCRKIVVKVPQL